MQNEVLITVCFYSLDLVVLGCDVSPATIQAVKSVLDDLYRRIRLPECPQVERYSLADIKSYLTRCTPRFCILVVDTDTSYKYQQPELEEILRTAADVVGKRICCSSLSIKVQRIISL